MMLLVQSREGIVPGTAPMALSAASAVDLGAFSAPAVAREN
jgi:hypothetical protein